jgi:hypothetical protein
MDAHLTVRIDHARSVTHQPGGFDILTTGIRGGEPKVRRPVRQLHTACVEKGVCKLQPHCRAAPDRTAPRQPCATSVLRDFDLGGTKPILASGRSVSCSLLNQQAFRLEKEFEVDHGFHRTPLVPGRSLFLKDRFEALSAAQ